MLNLSHKIYWIILALVGFAIYSFIVVGSINKPFATDEIYNAGWASGVAQNGRPAYYSGEGVSFHKRLKEPLSHPPLHVFLLAVMISIFGLKYWALRMLGVVLFMLCLLFLRFKVYKDEPEPDKRLILTGLLLIFNPLFTQQSMVLAIEAQAFWFFLLIFLFFFYKETVNEPRFAYFPYLTSSLAMLGLFWLKETNIPIYIASCLIYSAVCGRWKRIPHFLVSVIITAGVFWLTWRVYCALFDVDVYSWWNFTVKNKMAKESSVIYRIVAEKGVASALDSVIRSLRTTISWISLPYLILFIVAAAVRIREIIVEKRRIGFVELCFIYTVVLFAVTKFVRPSLGFLKYEVPAHLTAAIFISDVLLFRLQKNFVSFFWMLIAGVIAGFGMYFFFPDRILGMHRQFPFHIALSAGIVLFAGVLWRLVKKEPALLSGMFGSIFALVALNMTLSMHQALHSYTTGQSLGNYGEDLTPTIRWLDRNLKNGETFAAFKDLQFDMRFVEGKRNSKTYEARVFTKWVNVKRDKKIEILHSGKVKYIVLNKYTKTPDADEFLTENNYRRIKKIGSHIIYQAEKCPSCDEARRKTSATRRDRSENHSE